MAQPRKSTRKSRVQRPNQASTGPARFESYRELIVITRPEVGLRAGPEGRLTAAVEAAVSPLADLLASSGATLTPLFGMSEERIATRTAGLPGAPNLSPYYKVEAPDDRLDDLATQLLKLEVVEAAYVKHTAEPAREDPAEDLNDMLPRAEAPPVQTPDFTVRQGYLDPAPGGIDARFAWTQAGGSGAGVRIVNVEGAWRFTHEDLTVSQGGVIGGTPSANIDWRNHGTAVIGEFSGDRNSLGITGICPDANTRAISIFGSTGSATAIRQAAGALSAGDIILIELHRPGPRFAFAAR